MLQYFQEVAYPAAAAYVQDYLYPRFLEMVRVPLDQKEVIWALAPLVITLLLIQMYFGRHRHEELGWESAYGNSIVLIFVTVDLMRHIISRYGYEAILVVGGEAFYKSVIVGGVLLVAISLFFIDFFHSISKRISFFLSSTLVIVFFAFLATISVYSHIPFDRHTAVTVVLLFVVLYLFFKIFRSIVPPSPEAEEFLEKKHRERLEKFLKKEQKLKDHIKVLKEKIEF